MYVCTYVCKYACICRPTYLHTTYRCVYLYLCFCSCVLCIMLYLVWILLALRICHSLQIQKHGGKTLPENIPKSRNATDKVRRLCLQRPSTQGETVKRFDAGRSRAMLGLLKMDPGFEVTQRAHVSGLAHIKLEQRDAAICKRGKNHATKSCSTIGPTNTKLSSLR